MHQSRYKMSLPTCPICSKIYDMYYHIPRVLPKCGHTFCQKCIKSKLANKKNRLTFTCIQCESDAIIRKNVSEELPKNITIVQLIKDVKFKAVEQDQIGQANILCPLHSKKIEMICLTCNNRPICPHCAVFGEHKGHNIGSQENATNEDMKQLKQVLNLIENTVKHMLLPDSPENLQKQSKKRLSSTLQMYIKQNFKYYYQQISRKETELLEQCQSVMIDQKSGHYLDDILTSFDTLKMKGSNMKIMSRSQVQEIMETAKDLHYEIKKVVESFNTSIENFLEQSRPKIKETVFFDIRLLQRRTIKTILKGSPISPDGKDRQKQGGSNKKIENKKQQMITKKSQIKQALQRKNVNNISANISEKAPSVSQRIEKTKSIVNVGSNTLSSQNSKSRPSKLIVVNQKNKNQDSNPNKKAYSSAIMQPQYSNQYENQNILDSKLNKNASVKKAQHIAKTPQKTHTISRQKSPIDFQSDLKFVKPTKQINYQLRPKLQSILNQIDRQPSQGPLQLISLEITDPMIPYICQYLKTKKLKYSMIKMVKNFITDQGCRVLLSYLASDNFTKVLNLTSNQLTHRTLSSILNFIAHNSICKSIYLSHNKISPMQLKKIQTNLQNKFVQVVL